MLSKLSLLVSRAMLVLSAVLALVLSFVVCVDVTGRLAFNTPLRGTPELVSAAIVIICFMQLPNAIRSGGMVSVDFLVKRFPPKLAAVLSAVGAMLGLVFFAFVLWGALEPLQYAWTAGEYEGEGALRVPVWPAKLAVVVGAALAAVNYALLVVEQLAAVWTGAPPQQRELGGEEVSHV